MSLVAKFSGGKQINRCQKGSYEHRCQGAGLHFQLGPEWHVKASKAVTCTSPAATLKKYTQRRFEMKRQTMSRKRRLVEESGVSADRAITQPAIRHPIMDQVVKSQTCRLPYCLRTQKGSCRTYRWMTASEQASKKRRVGKPAVPNGTSKEGSAFTASNFYAVCTRKDSTPCDALVKRLLQPKGFTTAATEHGKQHESVALQLYATEKETVVQPCGLFIDLKHGFLAATPDGLVGTDRIVEVKCPLKYKEHEPLEAARNFSEKKQ